MKCKRCNNEMVIRLSKKGYYKDFFFWGCSRYPSCTNTVKTLLRNETWERYESRFCSDPFCLITPKITDWQRHACIHKYYQWDHFFSKNEIEQLVGSLGFNTINEFIFWICTQNRIGVSHNIFPVPSPYIDTFRNLTAAVNDYFMQITQSIIEEADKIENAIGEWRNNRNGELKRMRPFSETEKSAFAIELAKQKRNRLNRLNRLKEIQNFKQLSFEQVEDIQNQMRIQFTKTTFQEKLIKVVNDLTFPPEYYPVEWFKLNDDEISMLNIDLINKLIDKLHTKVRGERKKFKMKIIKVAGITS